MSTSNETATPASPNELPGHLQAYEAGKLLNRLRFHMLQTYFGASLEHEHLAKMKFEELASVIRKLGAPNASDRILQIAGRWSERLKAFCKKQKRESDRNKKEPVLTEGFHEMVSDHAMKTGDTDLQPHVHKAEQYLRRIAAREYDTLKKAIDRAFNATQRAHLELGIALDQLVCPDRSHYLTLLTIEKELTEDEYAAQPEYCLPWIRKDEGRILKRLLIAAYDHASRQPGDVAPPTDWPNVFRAGLRMSGVLLQPEQISFDLPQAATDRIALHKRIDKSIVDELARHYRPGDMLFSQEEARPYPDRMNTFRLEGDSWKVKYVHSDSVTQADSVKDSVGMRCISLLLANKRKPVSAGALTGTSEVKEGLLSEHSKGRRRPMAEDDSHEEEIGKMETREGAVSGGTCAQEILSSDDVEHMKDRIRTLERSIKELRESGKEVQADECAQDIAAIKDSLKKNVGPKGQKRTFSQSGGMNTKSSEKNIARAIDRLTERMPYFALHLRLTCLPNGDHSAMVYCPDPDVAWDVIPVPPRAKSPSRRQSVSRKNKLTRRRRRP